MSATITYNNVLVVDNLPSGKTATLPVKDLKMATNIQVTAVKDPPNLFDGTINIESGFTTISGSYIIDEQKAYDALLALTKTKTYSVNFSAGGSGSGMGDSIDFTSMTFDKENGLIKYDDKGAFAMSGGFAEYTNNYGDGNGAWVSFAENTEVRKDFKVLFLSIADVYNGRTPITFTIEGATYQAESDMTWAEWVASDYNQDGFVISNGYFEASSWRIVDSAGNSQRATDKIVESEAYAIDWGNTN